MFEHLVTGLQRPNFIAFVVLFLWGFFIMVTHPNLVKKLIGMYLVQTSVILLLVTFSAKKEATVPIVTAADMDRSATQLNPADYTNPLPHVLTLTAIVVQVATLGVSLALVTAIYQQRDSLNEDEILKSMQ